MLGPLWEESTDDQYIHLTEAFRHICSVSQVDYICLIEITIAHVFEWFLTDYPFVFRI